MAASADFNCSRVQVYMKVLKEKYDEIRGLSKKDINQFWDVVAITTADELQKSAYAHQIKWKVARQQLPRDVPYLLYADPPGVKIGSGGSVLNALKELHSRYGDELFTFRVLVICAGGQSQRLPTASVLGKLFLPLPFAGSQPYHMLDFKLAVYHPFLDRMKPGIFITCSDDIETYFMPSDDPTQDPKWSFSKIGFTALGHISSINIGKHHGVYVIPRPVIVNDDSDVATFLCDKVLQKPSVDTMAKWNAILNGGGSVCTDSVFFFDDTVCRALVNYVQCIGEMSCEIDAYGDFLQPLGKQSNREYIHGTDTVINATSSLAAVRENLFLLLRCFPLHVVVLKQSNFYHLGTMTEYTENLTPSKDNRFFNELSCNSFAHSTFSDMDLSTEAVKQFSERNPCVTVMHSIITSDVQVGPCSVLEFCDVKGPLTVGDHCIISNCRIIGNDLPAVPPRSCFHTAAVQFNGCEKYVTIAFGVDDDLKMSAGRSNWKEKLVFNGVPLRDACPMMEISTDTVFGSSDLISCSLWNAQLFPACDTMEQSFRRTLSMVCDLRLPEATPLNSSQSEACMSMEALLKFRNIGRMLEFQEQLWLLIENKR